MMPGADRMERGVQGMEKSHRAMDAGGRAELEQSIQRNAGGRCRRETLIPDKSVPVMMSSRGREHTMQKDLKHGVCTSPRLDTAITFSVITERTEGLEQRDPEKRGTKGREAPAPQL